MCTSYVLYPTADLKNFRCHVCLQAEEVDIDPKAARCFFACRKLKFKQHVAISCMMQLPPW